MRLTSLYLSEMTTCPEGFLAVSMHTQAPEVFINRSMHILWSWGILERSIGLYPQRKDASSCAGTTLAWAYLSRSENNPNDSLDARCPV